MFKRVLSLCAAFVLVAGASGDLFALKESDVRIKVLNPADGMFAKIGDTVHVEVYTFHADSAAIDADHWCRYSRGGGRYRRLNLRPILPILL